MSELISGKEALIALLSDKDVQLLYDNENWDLIEDWKSWDVKTFLTNDNYGYKFRLKPRTITLNTEIPVTFNPKDGDVVFVLDNANPDGFSSFVFDSDFFTINFGAWRTEEEIKQVVAALREVFK